MKFCYLSLITSSLLIQVRSLENGLARTPPMGWLAWERFKCNTNCKKDPKNCISERLFMEMADRLVKDGYRDAGYVYINIDDCWMAPKRDQQGNMVADPERFPRGIRFLSDYMHSRGLKLGIYQDFGERTCMGYPGIIGHMVQDANKFAEWKVDMVKLDGCHSHPKHMDKGYITMGMYLNKTHRPMVYSCSWPYYQLVAQMEPNYKLISDHCNMWRNFDDIQDSWKSVLKVIQFFGDNQEVLAPHTGPGHWNDPDMLMIGNFHLTMGQSRAQMAVWAILPAPLLMSNDLRSIDSTSRQILLNNKVISINQDPLGLPGKRIYKKHHIDIWKRPILPKHKGDTSYALLFLNKRTKKSIFVTFQLKNLGLQNKNGYIITDIFNEKSHGLLKANDSLKIFIPSMDVVMLKCEILRKLHR